MAMMITMITMMIKLRNYEPLSAQRRQILGCKCSVIQGFYFWCQMFKGRLALAIGLIIQLIIQINHLVVIIQCIIIYLC